MGIEVCYLSQLEILQILAFCVASNPRWNQKHHPRLKCCAQVQWNCTGEGIGVLVQIGDWCQLPYRVRVCLVRHPAFSGPDSQLCSAYGNHGIQATDKAIYATSYPLTSLTSSGQSSPLLSLQSPVCCQFNMRGQKISTTPRAHSNLSRHNTW